MPGPALTALLVAASGFCSLIYQVLWERTLRYSVGGDSVSAAIVTGTFLLGLGVGALVFGRWHDRPFRRYALVEAGIGLFGMASFHLLTPLAHTLAVLFPSPVSAAEGVRPLVVAACVLFLLPPCILIGGTGPLMFNCFVRPGPYGARSVGLLYGMNTAGAAAGVLAAPFLLLNRLSLPAALAVTGGLNLLLASALWRYGEAVGPVDPVARPLDPVDPGAPLVPWRRLLVLAFVSGLVSLAYEVALVRALFIQNPSSPYNFPAALIPYLVALALGSVVFTRVPRDHGGAPLHRVGLCFVGAALGMLLAVLASGTLTRIGYRAATMAAPAGDWVFLLHAVLLGATFPLFLGGVIPLLLRLAAPTGQSLPARTGRLFLVNSIGAFAGALLTQFVAFPALGMRGLLTAILLPALTAGGVCLWEAGHWRAPGRVALLAVMVAACSVPWLVPGDLWRAFGAGVTKPSADVVEGVTGVAAIEWTASGGDVIVNGQYMSRLPDHPRHVRLVSFALAMPRREAVLLLGLGGGGMVRELAHDPGIRRLEVVDWSHELPRLLAVPRARQLLDDALASPGVTLRRSDARVAVSLYEAGRFDVVVDNLTVAHWVGATAVKSIEYFRQIRRILRPGGVLVYHGNWGGARRAILAALTETFRHVRLHPGTGAVDDEVVLASDLPLVLDPAHVAAVASRLAASTGMLARESWLDGLVAVTRADVARARPVRDDLLIYEYHRKPVRAVGQWLRALVR
jgi:spermidine synthase